MTVFDSCRPVYQAIQPRHRHACGYRLANDGVRLDAEIGRIEAPVGLDLGGGAAQAEFSAAHDMDAVGKALARSRPTLATATFRTPRLHRAGARPVQGVLSRLITRTRISSDREGCRVGVAQLDCARLYSDDDFEPSQRQPSVQFALCGAARCASPVDTQVRLLSKLLRRQHYTLQTTQQSVTIETRRPIVGGRYETY
jgi:hypothetical protein